MNDYAVAANEPGLLDISSRQLRAFVLVADNLSYAKAAEQMHYSEPGVYRLVARLGDALGHELFERAGKEMRLTPEAVFILPTCRSMLRELERIGSIRPTASRSRRLVVAAGPLTGPFLLPAHIARFSAEEPEASVDMITAPPADISKMVSDGLADVGVCGGLVGFAMPPNVTVKFWRTEPNELYVRADLPQRAAAPRAIYSINWRGGAIAQLREQLRAIGVEIAEVRIVPSAEDVKGACLAGLGYALLPRSATELERRAGIFVEALAADQGVLQRIYVCYVAVPAPRANVQRFVSMLEEAGEPE